MGDESNMYYNSELKRWVERGKEHEAAADPGNAPPPTSASFSSPTPAPLGDGLSPAIPSAPNSGSGSRKPLTSRYVIQNNLSVSSSTSDLIAEGTRTPSTNTLLPSPPSGIFPPSRDSSTNGASKLFFVPQPSAEGGTTEASNGMKFFMPGADSADQPKSQGNGNAWSGYSSSARGTKSGRRQPNSDMPSKSAEPSDPLVGTVPTENGWSHNPITDDACSAITHVSPLSIPQSSITNSTLDHAASSDMLPTPPPAPAAWPGAAVTMEDPNGSWDMQHSHSMEDQASPHMTWAMQPTDTAPAVPAAVHDDMVNGAAQPQILNCTDGPYQAAVENQAPSDMDEQCSLARWGMPSSTANDSSYTSLAGQWVPPTSDHNAPLSHPAAELPSDYASPAAATVPAMPPTHQPNLETPVQAPAKALGSRSRQLLGALAGYVTQHVTGNRIDDADESGDAWGFEAAMHPGTATKLDGPLPWELPEHLRYSDEFLSICTAWQRNNPGKLYSPELLTPCVPAVADAAVEATAGGEWNQHASAAHVLAAVDPEKEQLSPEAAWVQGHALRKQQQEQKTLEIKGAHGAVHDTPISNGPPSHPAPAIMSLVPAEAQQGQDAHAGAPWQQQQEQQQEPWMRASQQLAAGEYERPGQLAAAAERQAMESFDGPSEGAYPDAGVLGVPALDAEVGSPAQQLLLADDGPSEQPAWNGAPDQQHHQHWQPLVDELQLGMIEPKALTAIQQGIEVPPYSASPEHGEVSMPPLFGFDAAAACAPGADIDFFDQPEPSALMDAPLNPELDAAVQEVTAAEGAVSIPAPENSSMVVTHDAVAQEVSVAEAALSSLGQVPEPVLAVAITAAADQQLALSLAATFQEAAQVQGLLFAGAGDVGDADQDTAVFGDSGTGWDLTDLSLDAAAAAVTGLAQDLQQSVEAGVEPGFLASAGEAAEVQGSKPCKVQQELDVLVSDLVSSLEPSEASDASGAGNGWEQGQEAGMDDYFPGVELPAAAETEPAEVAGVAACLEQLLQSVRIGRAVTSAELSRAVTALTALGGSPAENPSGRSGATPTKPDDHPSASSLHTPQRLPATTPFLVNPSPSPAYDSVEDAEARDGWSAWGGSPASAAPAAAAQAGAGGMLDYSSALEATKRELQEDFEAKLEQRTADLEARYKQRLEAMRAELEAEYGPRLAERDAELEELKQRCEEMQEDMDQLLLCLGQESRKVADLSQVMTDAGLDPEAIILPIEEEYALMETLPEEQGEAEQQV